MAWLVRGFIAKVRHSIGNKKYLKEKLLKYGNLMIVTPVFVIPPVVLWFSENEEALIPKAEKYVLIGEQNVIQNVRQQIIAEHRCTLVERWKSKENILDIQILNRDNEKNNYDKYRDKTIKLLLCLSTKTDQNWMEYRHLEELLHTIKSKYILVETQPGEFNVSKDLIRNLIKDTHLANLFEGSEVRCLPPKVDSIYKNTKLIISDREYIFCLYSLMVLVTSVLLIRRGTMYNIRKKLN